MAGHSHAHAHGEELQVSSTAKRTLTASLVAVGLLALIVMVLLWPTSDQMQQSIHVLPQPPGVTYVDAKVTSLEGTCAERPGPSCIAVQVQVLTGPDAGTAQTTEIDGPQASSGLEVGDKVELVRIQDEQGRVGYSFNQVERTPAIAVLGLVFVIAVLVVARWKGLFALVGLGVAAFVLLRFMLPAIIIGRPGVAVALAGSTVIMFVVLYVAHGVSMKTSAALAGTLVGLGLTVALGAVSVKAARLSGFPDENAYDLGLMAPGIDFQQLLMVAIIVGGLGVLNDVTITQSSAVWELRAAAPHWTRRQVFAAGMRIGRDHIASTIYTIVFAYAGASIAVLMLMYFTSRTPLESLNMEMFAGEAVRTLGSSIGLVLAVPVTTAIAALTTAPAKQPVPNAN